MPQTILVIEDDEATQELISDILSEAGYTVLTANHGSAALFIVGSAMPDLIMLDIKMPIMDGPAFAQRLAARRSAVPILVISSDMQNHAVAEEIGASAYLTKPIETTDLLNTVYQLLAGAKPRSLSEYI